MHLLKYPQSFGRNSFITCLILVLGNFPVILHAAGEDISGERDPYPYTVRSVSGTSIQDLESKQAGLGEGSFRFNLVADGSKFWDMGDVTVLGVEFRNTGDTELILDLRLCNENATTWSNSALGRTVVRPGESYPLGVALPRAGDAKDVHPYYQRMSGKPDGTFRHWHRLDASKVRRLEIQGTSVGPHSFEIGALFPLRKLTPELMGVYPFIDPFGQYIHGDWDAKVASVEDLKESIEIEEKLVSSLKKASGRSRFGGWDRGPDFAATGKFRVEKHNGRWWFVDPEGNLFWSFGVTCVGLANAGQTSTERSAEAFDGLPSPDDPDLGQFHIGMDVEHNYQLRENAPHFDFSSANLYRKYGSEWRQKYMDQELKRLHYVGVNTIGAWSDDEITQSSDVPYTVMVHFVYEMAANKLPDPYDPRSREGLRKSLSSYPIAFQEDPRCLGAFVNNELHWQNNAKDLVKSILVYGTKPGAAKSRFSTWLQEKYGTVEAFNAAWGTSIIHWNQLLHGMPGQNLSKADNEDCSALASMFADAYFSMVKEELENIAPGTLYLGCRFNAGGAEVIRAAANHVDVISANLYQYRANPGPYAGRGKPVLISEFHFGNVTGNNLGSGLRSAQDAVQQARLLETFLKDAVDDPGVVGAHWFQWRDQNVGGRYDGENYDIGFFDVTDQPKQEMVTSVAEFASTLYELAE